MGKLKQVAGVVLHHFGIGKGEAKEPPKQPTKAGIGEKKAYPEMTQGEQLKRLDMDESKGKK